MIVTPSTIARDGNLGRQLNARVVRALGTELLTIRIDLDPV